MPGPQFLCQADGRRPIAGKFALDASQHVSFTLGDDVRSQALVIDPVIVYSTYLGGSTE
jgi:hypothetical protein